MNKFVIIVSLLCLTFVLVVKISLHSQSLKEKSPLDFAVFDIKGKAVNLSDYKGNVVLIVAAASKGGFTLQYEQLRQIYEKYKHQEFVVLGFPANDFRQQEPGTNEEILNSCTSKYNVSFPMFSKNVVIGKGKTELYKFLTDAETDPNFSDGITWNFGKFLLGRDGDIIARYKPKTRPDDPEVISTIEKLLSKK